MFLEADSSVTISCNAKDGLAKRQRMNCRKSKKALIDVPHFGNLDSLVMRCDEQADSPRTLDERLALAWQRLVVF